MSDKIERVYRFRVYEHDKHNDNVDIAFVGHFTDDKQPIEYYCI